MRITAQPRNTCNRRYNKPPALCFSLSLETEIKYKNVGEKKEKEKKKLKTQTSQNREHGLFVTVYAMSMGEISFFVVVLKEREKKASGFPSYDRDYGCQPL